MLIQKAELAQYINRLKSIVPKKTSFSVLQGILVRDSFGSWWENGGDHDPFESRSPRLYSPVFYNSDNP